VKRSHWGIVLITLVLLAFSCYRHYESLSWDFCAYSLNAQYWFQGGTYYETYRPPLTSLVLGFGFLFGNAGEYVFILLACGLFVYANIRLAYAVFPHMPWPHDPYKQPSPLTPEYVQTVFLLCSLTPFVMLYSFRSGSELLSLALLELFLADVLRGRVSGHFLALAFLTRFNMLIFAPLMFFNKDYKKIIKSVSVFLLLIFPYLLFNFVHYGNWFTGIIDSYALNVVNREYMSQPMTTEPFIQVGGFMWILAGIGVLSAIGFFYKWNTELVDPVKMIPLFFFVVAGMIIVSFNGLPTKLPRYLFNLSLPIAFFATLGIASLISQQRQLKPVLIVLLSIWFGISTLSLTANVYRDRDYDDLYRHAAGDIEKLGLQNTYIMSSHWIPLHYLAGNVYPLGQNDVEDAVNDGYVVLLVKHKAYQSSDHPYNMKQVESLPRIKETNNYVFLGKNPPTQIKRVYDFPYINNHSKIVAKKFSPFDDQIYWLLNLINRDMSDRPVRH
jgi:hypothetical protein